MQEELRTGLEDRKVEIRLAVSTWFNKHLRPTIDKQAEYFTGRYAREETVHMAKSMLLDKLRTKLGQASFTFTLDDLINEL